MAIQTRNQLKEWYVTEAKPFQYQYWDWIDSYWHKLDQLPMSSITGLIEFINSLDYLTFLYIGGGSEIEYTIGLRCFIPNIIFKTDANATLTITIADGEPFELTLLANKKTNFRCDVCVELNDQILVTSSNLDATVYAVVYRNKIPADF